MIRVVCGECSWTACTGAKLRPTLECQLTEAQCHSQARVPHPDHYTDSRQASLEKHGNKEKNGIDKTERIGPKWQKEEWDPEDLPRPDRYGEGHRTGSIE